MNPIGAVLCDSDRQLQRARLFVSACAFMAVLFATGCGSNGPQRLHLEGKVTFGGEPVPNGLIRFEPDSTQGNAGPVGYAAIKDGRYTTAEKGSKGALKGPIVAYMTGGPAADPKVEFPKMWFIDYRTTLTLEQKSGVTTFDFDVPNQAPKPK